MVHLVHKTFIIILTSVLFFHAALFPSKEQIELLTPIVIKKHPKEPAFTQGLAIRGSYLYESTGLYGQSKIRVLDLTTNQIIVQYDLPPNYFGEGIAIKGEHLYQLTWNENIALIYKLEPLRFSHHLPFKWQGWGLCTDGDSLLATNGTSELHWLNPTTFTLVKKRVVKFNGKPIQRLNDLECVGKALYINIWLSDYILRVDKESGKVTGVIDASQLLTEQEKSQLPQEAVLNGIVYRSISDTFFITGKYWPYLFEVRFQPAS